MIQQSFDMNHTKSGISTIGSHPPPLPPPMALKLLLLLLLLDNDDAEQACMHNDAVVLCLPIRYH
jgi:hypothetical protein